MIVYTYILLYYIIPRHFFHQKCSKKDIHATFDNLRRNMYEKH